MTHPYNDDSTPIVSTSPSRKDEYGIFFIGLIAFLGLGYLLFNPTHIHSSNYPTDDDTKIHISASNLNSEKITYDLLETRTSSMDTQIATDSKN